MTSKIIKSTTKGQITLPKQWRGQFNTDNFLLLINQHQIIVKPVKIDTVEEEVIFDADRDNAGKGITPDAMIKMLKKIKNG